MSRLHFKRIAARAMRKQCVIHKDDWCTHRGANAGHAVGMATGAIGAIMQHEKSYRNGGRLRLYYPQSRTPKWKKSGAGYLVSLMGRAGGVSSKRGNVR